MWHLFQLAICKDIGIVFGIRHGPGIQKLGIEFIHFELYLGPFDEFGILILLKIRHRFVDDWIFETLHVGGEFARIIKTLDVGLESKIAKVVARLANGKSGCSVLELQIRYTQGFAQMKENSKENFRVDNFLLASTRFVQVKGIWIAHPNRVQLKKGLCRNLIENEILCTTNGIQF